MMRPSSIMVGVLIALALPGASASYAQSAGAPPGFYSPKAAVQFPPLRVQVIDGGRFRDIESDAVFRLYGIDTCAPGQTANLGRQPWPCGTMATAWLVTATLNAWLACRTLREEGGERLARCASAGHSDLAADMLRDGVAVALPPTAEDPGVRAYALAEQEARKSFRGLWSSTFQMPWDWRATQPTKRDGTVTAGATP